MQGAEPLGAVFRNLPFPPWKVNMEPENHLVCRGKPIFQTFIVRFHVNFQGCMNLTSHELQAKDFFLSISMPGQISMEDGTAKDDPWPWMSYFFGDPAQKSILWPVTWINLRHVCACGIMATFKSQRWIEWKSFKSYLISFAQQMEVFRLNVMIVQSGWTMMWQVTCYFYLLI